MILYCVARFCSFVCWRLPSPVCYFLACIIGDFLYLFWRRARRSVKQNITGLLGNEASQKVINKAARQSLRNFCKYCVDFLRFYHLPPDNEEGKLTVKGIENLDKALRGGKGAILVSLHMGNWDIGATALSRLGYPINVIVESLKFSYLNRFLHRLRTRLGLKVITTREGITRMAEVLRQNEILALLIDCPKHDHGVKVNFCNSQIRMPAGAATLALRTGAKVVPCGLVRLRNNTFLAFINQHLSFQRSGNLAEDIQELTQHITTALENLVKKFPDQWYMFQPLSK